MKSKHTYYIITTLIAVCIGTSVGKAYAKMSEADYVNQTCEGLVEYRLPDKARVDCLTGAVAYEYDYGSKWAEAIGQSLYYSVMTRKQAGIRLICRSHRCPIYQRRLFTTINDKNLGIKVEIIKRR